MRKGVGSDMAEVKDCQASILELRLGRPRQTTSARYYEDLGVVAGDLNRARNHMVRAWERWREDHPEFVEGMHPQRIPDPNPRSRRTASTGTQTFGNYLWREGCQTSSNVSATVLSQVNREVLANLKTAVNGHENTTARWRWQAILRYEEAATCFRERSIPVPRSCLVIGYDGLTWAGMNCTKRDKDLAATWCRSGAFVCFPLFSRMSGRAVLNPFVNVEVGQLSDGNKRVLRRILAGEYTVCDSRVTERRGQWILQLCYRRPDQR